MPSNRVIWVIEYFDKGQYIFDMTSFNELDTAHNDKGNVARHKL